MKNIFVNRIKLFAAAVSLLLICSCSDDFSGTGQDKNYPSKDGKTYLCLSAALSPEARSIAPGASDYDVTQLTNLVLTGKLSSESGDETQLASASDYTAIDGKNIPVSVAGSWTFTLTADFKGVPFTGTVEQEITEGSVNTLTFTLKSEQNQGGMEITFKFTGSSTEASDYKVLAKLFNSEKTEEIDTKIFENTEDDPAAVIACSTDTTNKTFYVVYSCSSSDKAEYLDSSTYYLVFEVFDTRTKDEVPLNTSRNFVRVDKGITTTGELSLTLNEVYSITYNNNGGEFAEGAIPCNYSRKSEGIKLPQMIKSGCEFAGWYNNEKFEGDPVSEISAGTTGNLTFWAYFIEIEENEEENVLYVYPKGSETNTGSLDSIADAVAKIIANPDPDADWTIKIDGILTGPQKIEGISEEHAASLTICGANALNSEGNPSDEIIADIETPGSHALNISASLPVTIKDIKITKGEDGEDDPSYGVYVEDGSKIYLAGTPVIEDLYVENNEYYDWATGESYGAISISKDLGDKTSVTITPQNEWHYPYFDYDESHEVCITQYVFAIGDLSVVDYCKKFEVTPKKEDDSTYFIDEDGRINKNISVTFKSNETNQTLSKNVLFGSDPSKLGISLNDYTGYSFAGWFKSNEDGVLTDKVTLIYEDNLTLYAKWVQPVDDLYVNAGDSGSDKNAGTSESPLKTVSAAVAKIKDFGVELDYTIHVTGLSAENVIIDGSISAQSITLQGASGNDNGISCDSGTINTVMTISSLFPVTLKNFTIKPGNCYGSNGMAINISGSEVTLSSGTVIDGSNAPNKSTGNWYGAVYVSGGTLTLEGDASITSWNIAKGAGVYVTNYGTVNMKDTSSITKCSSQYGGGIYVDNGTVSMADNAVIGGTEENACSASYDGGGVYVKSGSFEMNGSAAISYCTAKGNGGGGVCVEGGEFTMKAGEISHNSFTGNSAKGGGVYLTGSSVFTMKGGSISENSVIGTSSTTKVYGAGVYIYDSNNPVFDMQGGIISGNVLNSTAGGYGSGVAAEYANYGTFKMSGSAIVNSDNDVYTYNIVIAGALEGTGTVATITPTSYDADNTVLTLDEAATGISSIGAVVDRFAVTSQIDDDNNEIKWTISSEGKLVK